MDTLKIDNISCNTNKLTINYSCEGVWNKYLSNNRIFESEYSENIESVPKSVLIIPLLTTLLPISWVTDAKIIVDDIDKKFYDSINDFKEGYINMYPNIDFKGKLIVRNICETKAKEFRSENKYTSAVMFSGGVDAFNSLVSHLTEKPLLITIWGADTNFNNLKAWKKVEGTVKNTANCFNLNNSVVRSNFRLLIEDRILNKLIRKSGDNWWHGFHHGIGLLGLVAPLAYVHNIETVYIASSFTKEQKKLWNVTCASDPTIDNYLKFINTSIIHDGYDYGRQDKIALISNHYNQNPFQVELKACSRTTSGTNCCRCEKCYRTILGFIAENQNPRDFGFYYSDSTFNVIAKDMKRKIVSSNKKNRRYEPIQENMRLNLVIEELPESIRWFYDYDFSNNTLTAIEKSLYYSEKFNYFIYRVRKKIKMTFLKVFS